MAKNYTIEKFNKGMHYLPLDPKTVAALSKSKNKRVVCTLNKEYSFHGAIQSTKEGLHYIYIGSSTCKLLKLKVGSTVSADFKIDESPYQFEMPEVFQEVLNTDPEALEAFEILTPGNQRSLMYLIQQVKSIDKKIERALLIAAKLKQGIHSPKLMLKK